MQDGGVRWLRWIGGLALAAGLVMIVWSRAHEHAYAVAIALTTVLVGIAHRQAALERRREFERLEHIGDFGWGLDPEFVARKLELIRHLKATSPAAHLRP
jgi:uncharacterized membrane protein HdeD (DUF308 family)